MDAKEYKKRLNALNREFIKANNPYKFGEVVLYNGRKLVLLSPTGVNVTSGCKVTYDCYKMDMQGNIIEKVEKVYGFETLKPTGEFRTIEEDLT